MGGGGGVGGGGGGGGGGLHQPQADTVDSRLAAVMAQQQATAQKAAVDSRLAAVMAHQQATAHHNAANTAAAVTLEKQKKQEKTEEAQILAEDADVGAGEVADTFADYEVLACVGA